MNKFYKPNKISKKNLTFFNQNIKEQEKFIISQQIVLELMHRYMEDIDNIKIFISKDVLDELQFSEDKKEDADYMWELFNHLTFYCKDGMTTDKFIGENNNNGLFPIIGFVSKKNAFTLEKLKSWITHPFSMNVKCI